MVGAIDRVFNFDEPPLYLCKQRIHRVEETARILLSVTVPRCQLRDLSLGEDGSQLCGDMAGECR